MSFRSMVPACVSGLVVAGLICLAQGTPERTAYQSVALADTEPSPRVTSSVYSVQPSPHAQSEFLGLLIQAIPGDVIELAAGKFNFDMDLEVSTNNITIRGQGPDKTILSFKNQHMGSKGIEATGDNFVIENLAVEDTRGNAIKVVGGEERHLPQRADRMDRRAEDLQRRVRRLSGPMRERADRRLHRPRRRRRGRLCRPVAADCRQELPRV